MAFYFEIGRKKPKEKTSANESGSYVVQGKPANGQDSADQEVINAYIEIGKYFYKKYEHETVDTEVAEFFGLISSKKKTENVSNGNTEAGSSQRKCVICGATLEETDVFCAKCGTRVEVISPVTETETIQETSEKRLDQSFDMEQGLNTEPLKSEVQPEQILTKKQNLVCEKCGFPIKKNYSFCGNCGEKIVLIENDFVPGVQAEPVQLPEEIQEKDQFDENIAENRTIVTEEIPNSDVQAIPKAVVKYCGQCGAVVEAGDVFCAYCGHKVSN